MHMFCEAGIRNEESELNMRIKAHGQSTVVWKPCEQVSRARDRACSPQLRTLFFPSSFVFLGTNTLFLWKKDDHFFWACVTSGLEIVGWLSDGLGEGLLSVFTLLLCSMMSLCLRRCGIPLFQESGGGSSLAHRLIHFLFNAGAGAED